MTVLSKSLHRAIRSIRKDITLQIKKRLAFTSQDVVLVLDFLAKIVQEFDTQEMNEGCHQDPP